MKKQEYHAIRINPELHKELKTYCKLKGYNMQGYIEIAVKLRRLAEADAEKMEK